MPKELKPTLLIRKRNWRATGIASVTVALVYGIQRIFTERLCHKSSAVAEIGDRSVLY